MRHYLSLRPGFVSTKAHPSYNFLSQLFRRILPGAVLSALLPGCASVGSHVRPEPSFAFDRPETTRLGSALAASQKLHQGKSGFALLDYDLEALVARAVAADTADRTIDAQYYIYDHDETGNLVTARLISAADRGVRIRLLLDDYNFRSKRELIALCAHPLIQVRIFNPVSHRLSWARLLEYAIHFRRADRRMHNKLFIADNEVTILGGRNVGDNYFNIEPSKAFRDFDVLAAASLRSPSLTGCAGASAGAPSGRRNSKRTTRLPGSVTYRRSCAIGMLGSGPVAKS